MRLTILGQYGPFPAADGACSGYLLEAGDSRVLLDCGPGVLGQLFRYMHPAGLTAVVLSHLHYDHMSDLLAMRYALEFSGRADKLPLYLPSAPAPLRALLDGGPYDLRPMLDTPIGGLDFAFLPAVHSLPGFSMRVKEGASSLLYTGDTNWHDGLVPFARGCAFVLADAAFTTAMWSPDAAHMSGALCARLAREAGAQALVLSHLRPDVDCTQVLSEARALFPTAQLAVAGMALTC